MNPVAKSFIPRDEKMIGYEIIASVDRIVTPTITSAISRSPNGLRGRTEKIASAAEAPQIATEPPDKIPKVSSFLKIFAKTSPNPIVKKTIEKTKNIEETPMFCILTNESRNPNKPTASFRIKSAVRSIPCRVLLSR